MNVVNLHSALDSASAVSSMTWLSRLAVSGGLRLLSSLGVAFHPPLRSTDGFARGECGAHVSANPHRFQLHVGQKQIAKRKLCANWTAVCSTEAPRTSPAELGESHPYRMQFKFLKGHTDMCVVSSRRGSSEKGIPLNG